MFKKKDLNRCDSRAALPNRTFYDNGNILYLLRPIGSPPARVATEHLICGYCCDWAAQIRGVFQAVAAACEKVQRWRNSTAQRVCTSFLWLL